MGITASLVEQFTWISVPKVQARSRRVLICLDLKNSLTFFSNV
jgi:hypothetical protein